MSLALGGLETDAACAQLEALRAACEAPGGGCAVMQAVGLCASHSLPLPPWLASCFIRMRALVVEAHVATWDEAIGRPWPARVHIATIRRNLLLKKRIHAAVWAAIKAEPTRGINRLLFDEIGELDGIAVSGSKVERLYYEAVAEGRLNVADWRRALRNSSSVIPQNPCISEDGSAPSWRDSRPAGSVIERHPVRL